jgi:peptidoglycan/LPS O-acetylase OafA/YrhL
VPDAVPPRAWLDTALLLTGFTGRTVPGYGAAAWLSVDLWTTAGLAALVAVLPSSVRFRGRDRRPRMLVAPAAGAVGTALLAHADGTQYTWGGSGFGRGLLGVGIGIGIYQLLAARSTASSPPPAPPAAVGGRPLTVGLPAGSGAALALAAFALSVYRSDLVLALHLMPVYPVVATLVGLLAQADESPVHAALARRPLRRLGGQAFAIFALSGPVLLALGWLCARLGLDPRAGRVALGVAVDAVAGTLLAAAFAHRYLERILDRGGRPRFVPDPFANPFTNAFPDPFLAPPVNPFAPGPPPPGPPPPRPLGDSGKRPRREIDLDAVPPELRLRPLPVKPLPVKPPPVKPLPVKPPPVKPPPFRPVEGS